MKKILLGAAILVLLVQFGFQIYMAKSDSQTSDEGVHLLAGYTYLTKHDYRFNPEHPPLVKVLAATPLLFLKLNTAEVDYYWEKSGDFLYDSWQENRTAAEKFLYSSGNNADQILFYARMPIVFLTLLLGLLIFAIAYRFWGPYGALVSTALYAFDPNIMAHGHLVTTDIGISIGFLLALSCGWLFLKNPSRRNILILGLGLGIAMLMKFTAIMLYPILIVLLTWHLFSVKADWVKVKRYIISFIGVILFSWLIIWAGYGFKSTLAPSATNVTQVAKNLNKPDAILPITQDQTTIADKAYGAIRYVMIPREYFKGLFMVLTHVDNGHDSFLLGQFSKTGWWYYFPVVFSAKTTIPALLLILAGIYYVIKSKDKRNAYFLVGALLYFAFAMTSKANLGLRHVLPVYPILYILAGILVVQKIKWFKIAIPILLVLIFAEFLAVKPFYLSYYNQFYGGMWNGYKVATDSNLDWGQDVKRIAEYLDRNPEINKPFVEYGWNGQDSLDYYNIDRSDFATNYIVIGASAIQSVTELNNKNYQYLKGIKYFDRITPSVFVYSLNQFDLR